MLCRVFAKPDTRLRRFVAILWVDTLFS